MNSFLEVQKFKYESIREAHQLAKLGDYLFSVGLKSGYHHVDVAPEYWQYLGFEWQGKCVFCQLPFVLATACFVFTKLIKQLVAHWRRAGIRVIPYINDFLFICGSASEFTAVQTRILADFAKAGFVLSHEKCQLQMSHVIKFLGFDVDTLHGVFHLTAHQKDKLRTAIDKCLQQPHKVLAKLLACTTGLITSMSLITGSVFGLFSRFLHRVLNTRASWNATVSLDPPACAEL
jgi:hypothetical protein